MKDWNVWVSREGCGVVIGTVSEENESLARCAALSRYAVAEEELASGAVPSMRCAILPDEDFGVSQA